MRHVVAGARGGPVVADRWGRRWRARVVLYDPKTDIAVLRVPGLGLGRLVFAARPAHREDDAVVAGYPGGQGFRAVAARVGQTAQAQGTDIYSSGKVTRQIYVIRADVQPGDSGGPLLTPDGHIDGVVFATVKGQPGTGYALTTVQVMPQVRAGTHTTREVSTPRCA
jgi:S1-C subfamily serine protease